MHNMTTFHQYKYQITRLTMAWVGLINILLHYLYMFYLVCLILEVDNHGKDIELHVGQASRADYEP